MGEASALHDLAEIYRGLDSPRQAITLYEQALQLYWGGQDHRRQVLTLYSLAYAYRQVEQPDRALSYYQQALAQCEQAGDRLILSRVYHARATLDWEMQQTAEAVRAMQQAVEISQAIGYLPGTVHGLLALTYMEARLGRRSTAQLHLQAALAPLNLTEDREGLREVENRLQLLAAGQLDLPEPPAHMNWIRTHIVLAEGKVYCEFESPVVAPRAR
jgi:tetratricopeptide (TPR) repeat protein